VFPTITPDQPELIGKYITLFHGDLSPNPFGYANDQDSLGLEEFVVELTAVENGKHWLDVMSMTNGREGWVTQAQVIFADPGSDEHVRRYGGAWCIATPVSAEKLTADITVDFQHSLTFPNQVVITPYMMGQKNGVLLLFQGLELGKNQYDLLTGNQHT